MPETLSQWLRELAPAIVQRWDDRVRAEVPASAEQEQIVLRDHVELMLEVVAKVLSAETDPKTAARDLAYITVHAEERANQSVYSLEEMVLECQILHEVVLEYLESRQALDDRERTIISRYFNELIRIAAGEFARIQANRLAAMNRAKDEFLAMLAHELRNPLGSISNSLMVLRASDPEEGTREALDIAVRQVGHMTQMVSDLLDVARISGGKVVLHMASLDLGLVVHDAVEAARNLFEDRQHHLTVSQEEGRIHVEGDATRLDQCLTNILANAAKYTPRGGNIEVIVEREGNEAIVRVRDTGVGIERQLLPKVFDLFQQANQSLDRPEGGLGIGLTVVRRLVEMHGGRVEAKSEGLGKGSEFWLRLPIREGRSEEANAQRRTTTTSVGVRVLVVDDIKDSADVLGRLLEILGHQVVVANDGPTALEAIKCHRPDLALVDIGLPGMTGYELALKLRASESCPSSMKLVALTGYAADPEALRAAGFDAHVTKPIDLEQLEEALACVVQTEWPPDKESSRAFPRLP